MMKFHHAHLCHPEMTLQGVVTGSRVFYLSIYLIYIAPLHRFLHRIRSALQYSLVQGLSVFHSFVRRSHLLQINSLGSIQMAAVSTSLLQCDNLGKHMFLHLPYCTSYNPTIRQKYGGWACSNSPHMFFYVHQSHRHKSTHPGLFELGSTPVIWTSIMQAEDGWSLFFWNFF